MTNADRLFARKADPKVLRRLSMVDGWQFSGREIARLEELNPSTARRSLEALVDVGLVLVQRRGFAYLYRLNREHILWPTVEALINYRKD